MATVPTSTLYRFGRCELQPLERRLLMDGAAVSLGPRGFDLLVTLVERAGHLVTKDELFARVWPRVVVDDSALQFQISSLRKALGADAIATVSGHGYRFVLPVTSCLAQDPREDPSMHNLPQGLARLIGRHGDTAHVRELLDRARLVTLVGAGGCGKTRLSIEVAATLAHRYRDGVRHVELAPLADGARLPQALLAALGVRETAEAVPIETLFDHLADRHLLLVLDNAEHLLSVCADLADQLLRRCAGLTLLVTSRQGLGLAGEQIYRVPSLRVPAAEQTHDLDCVAACESVELFVERARALTGFVLTPDNAPAVATICRRLDGIPLAIELAAGRLRAMPVDEVSRRLDRRFSLLQGSAAGSLPRHRTLRSLIDWSYDLLSEGEQALLCRLSVFAGGCSLQAAIEVCSDDVATSAVPDLLTALCDKNLLAADQRGEVPRYRLLETVRQYARDRLRESGDETRWLDRHLAHFRQMLRDCLPHHHGPDEQTWFDRFERENDNLRAALTWSRQADAHGELALRMATWMFRFWMVRGHLSEGREWFEVLRAASTAEATVQSRCAAVDMHGTLVILQGDHVRAKALFEEALVLARETGEPVRIAGALNNLGTVADELGDLDAAQPLYDEAAEILRAAGPPFKLASALVNVGNVAYLRGDLFRAETTLQEGLAIVRQSGEQQVIGVALRDLGAVALADGRPDDSRRLLAESLSVLGTLQDRLRALPSLEEFAYLEFRTGSGGKTRAARLWGSCEKMREAASYSRPPYERTRHAQRIAGARASYGDEAEFDRAWAEGRSMSFDEAIDLALSTASG